MIYDIPVIVSIEADTIEAARQIAYKTIENINDKRAEKHEANGSCPERLEFTMADDSATNRINQRIVFLHPEDCSSGYDFDEYNKKLEEEDKE
jgi:hypothetical protein